MCGMMGRVSGGEQYVREEEEWDDGDECEDDVCVGHDVLGDGSFIVVMGEYPRCTFYYLLVLDGC